MLPSSGVTVKLFILPVLVFCRCLSLQHFRCSLNTHHDVRSQKDERPHDLGHVRLTSVGSHESDFDRQLLRVTFREDGAWRMVLDCKSLRSIADCREKLTRAQEDWCLSVDMPRREITYEAQEILSAWKCHVQSTCWSV
jgi:hypothetical protein